MTVVNIDEKVMKSLTVGKHYLITGTFAQKSDNGFVVSKGLVIYDSITLSDENAPPKKQRRRRRR